MTVETLMLMPPKLELVNTSDGFLVVLKRLACSGRLAGWSSLPKHGSNCGCQGDRVVWVTVAVHLLRPGDARLEQCRLPVAVL